MSTTVLAVAQAHHSAGIHLGRLLAALQLTAPVLLLLLLLDALVLRVLARHALARLLLPVMGMQLLLLLQLSVGLPTLLELGPP